MTGIITSLPPSVEPPPSSTSGNPQVLGPLAYVPAIPNLPQTWTGIQTFEPNTLIYAGLTSGGTILNASANATGTLTLPSTTDTLVGQNTTDTLSNKTLVSPSISGATITTSTYNGNIWTAGTGTLTLGAGKTATISNTLTFTGTDSSSVAFGTGGTVAYQGGTLAQFAATTSLQLRGVISDETGSGSLVFATSPTLVTPVLGTPASGTLTNCTGLPLTGLANQAAWTFLFNNTSGSAAPTANTIDGLTLKASPAAGDEVIIWDVAGAALKKATVSGVGSSAGVSSIAGNTGAFTLSHGLTNSVNDIQLSLTNATLEASPANPTGTTSTAAQVMMGLGSTCKLTPVYSTRIHLTFDGTAGVSAAGNAASVQVRFGTGAAPANAAAATGTTVGSALQIISASSASQIPFSRSVIVTGLTPGTAYWFDLGLQITAGTGTATLLQLNFAAFEF